MDSLEERDNFLQRYHHPRLIQEQAENMNRPIIINKIESIIIKLLANKSPGFEGFWANSSKHLKKSILVLSKDSKLLKES